MFRTQEDVPEIYVNESRDFQLLCRLKDAIQGAIKYNIDSLRHLNNTLEMNSTLLPLLKSKVGFFKEDTLSEDQLRYLLAGFPYLMKYKGSKKAIDSAVNLWFRVNRIGGTLVSCDIDNTTYEITINIDTTPQDTDLLDTLFKYLIPTGYIVKYNFASKTEHTDRYSMYENLGGIVVNSNAAAQIRLAESDITIESSVGLDDETDFKKRNVGSIGTTQIYLPEGDD